MKTLFFALAVSLRFTSIYLAQFGTVLEAAPGARSSQAQTTSHTKISKASTFKPLQLVGEWYMGTMSGFDCNLHITSPNTLSVQYGGCFHQDPPIKTGWTLQGDRVQLQNSALHGSFGQSLHIVRYKNHLVLVPERSKLSPRSHKYSYTRCFWRNLMKNGLQLSKDAPT